MCSKREMPAKESDLYRPLRDYLEAQGYTVRSEVRSCDVIAERGGDVIVLELKRNLSVSLLVQAVDRQRALSSVYVVVPHPGKRARSREWHAACRLLKRLELGLVLVDLEPDPSGRPDRPGVEVVFHPAPAQRRTMQGMRRAILTEIHGRSVDLNQGGSTRRKIVTAYRENAVQIASYLEALGPMSPASLRRMGSGPNTGPILLNNFYRWFQRVSRGVYSVTAQGAEDILQYTELHERYSARALEEADRLKEDAQR